MPKVFLARRLRNIEPGEVTDERIRRPWSDCSEERELARKRFHDSLLQSVLGQDWSHQRFSWGAVDFGYDPEGGFSSIGLTYAF